MNNSLKNKDLIQIQLNLNRIILYVLIFCLAAEAVIFFLDIFLNIAELWYMEKFKRFSNVAMESSFGTWFSVVQNFIVGITALIISMHYRFISKNRGGFICWLLTALFFAYISLDDHLVLHERMGGSITVFAGWLFGKNITLPTYGWLFLFGPLFGAFGIFFLVFMYRELRTRKFRLILITGLFLWGAAVLLDAWDGMGHSYEWIVNGTGLKKIYIRHCFMLFEEMLEMLGSTLFLYLFLSKFKLLTAP